LKSSYSTTSLHGIITQPAATRIFTAVRDSHVSNGKAVLTSSLGRASKHSSVLVDEKLNTELCFSTRGDSIHTSFVYFKAISDLMRLCNTEWHDKIPRSRVLLEKLILAQLDKKFPTSFETRRSTQSHPISLRSILILHSQVDSSYQDFQSNSFMQLSLPCMLHVPSISFYLISHPERNFTEFIFLPVSK
jgi:hypothetical protein